MTTTSFTRGAPGSPLHSWIVDNEAALATLSPAPTAEDVNRVARAADTGALYVLLNHSPATWVCYTRPTLSVEAISGTTYTLVLADAWKLKQTTNGSPVTVTVPPNASVAFPLGTQVHFEQNGAGALTLAPGSGVTLDARVSLVSAGQYGALTATKTATNRWLVTGDQDTP